MLIESSSRLQSNSEVACFPQSLTSKKLPNLPGLRRPLQDPETLAACHVRQIWALGNRRESRPAARNAC